MASGLTGMKMVRYKKNQIIKCRPTIIEPLIKNTYSKREYDVLVFAYNVHQDNPQSRWDKKFYFLDWEYSGPNHPCFDIASIVKTYQLNQSEIDYFSIGYGGNKELFKIKKLNQWITFIQYLDEIWKISVNRLIEQLTDDAD